MYDVIPPMLRCVVRCRTRFMIQIPRRFWAVVPWRSRRHSSRFAPQVALVWSRGCRIAFELRCLRDGCRRFYRAVQFVFDGVAPPLKLSIVFNISSNFFLISLSPDLGKNDFKNLFCCQKSKLKNPSQTTKTPVVAGPTQSEYISYSLNITILLKFVNESLRV